MKLYSGSDRQVSRPVLVTMVALLVLVCLATGLGAWWVNHRRGPQPTMISAFTRGQLVQVEPYRFCDVIDLDDCVTTEAMGVLQVDAAHPVQLSVGNRISEAPWRLLLFYDNYFDSTITTFRPGSTLTATIPTVDPLRGRLRGMTVLVPTLAVDQFGNLIELPHAEWAVQLNWPITAAPAAAG